MPKYGKRNAGRLLVARQNRTFIQDHVAAIV
jgi:hypothetical protein